MLLCRGPRRLRCNTRRGAWSSLLVCPVAPALHLGVHPLRRAPHGAVPPAAAAAAVAASMLLLLRRRRLAQYGALPGGVPGRLRVELHDWIVPQRWRRSILANTRSCTRGSRP